MTATETRRLPRPPRWTYPIPGLLALALVIVSVVLFVNTDPDPGRPAPPPPETTTTTAPEWQWIGSTDPVTGKPVRCLLHARLAVLSCFPDTRPEATTPPLR